MTPDLAVHELPTLAPLPARPDVAFDRFADVVRRSLDVPLALVSLVDARHQVNPGQFGLPLPPAETRSLPLAMSVCQYVVRSASALVIGDARDDDQLATHAAVVSGHVVAYLGFPLHDLTGATVGSLCAIDREPRRWGDDEVDLIRDLAEMCSAELQLRESAASAHAARELSAALLELSEALSRAVTIGEITEAVRGIATHNLAGVFGGITTFDAGSRTLRYADLAAVPAAHADYSSFPLTRRTPSAVAAREQQSLFFETGDSLSSQFPETASVVQGAGFESACYLPLQVDSRVLGTLSMVWDRPRAFPAAERSLLNALARYTAQAVHRAALLTERHEVAYALQSEMLPVLPPVAWLRLSGCYLPASETDAVGGDWYDAFELSGRELAVSVGDVEGHDARAAAVMGRARSILRGVAATPPAVPGDVLTVVDRVLSQTPSGRFATGLFGVLRRDPHGDTFTWSNAGHLPPLLITADRLPVFLDADVDPPLAAGLATVPRRSRSIVLPPCSTLLLFTDGLVERREAAIDNALQTLVDVTHRARHLPLQEMVTAVVGGMLRDGQDDLVLLAVRNSTDDYGFAGA